MYHGNATFSNSILLSSAQSWLSDHMITADVSKPHSSLIKVNLTSNGTSDSHEGEFSLVASIKVKFLASVTKNVVLSF